MSLPVWRIFRASCLVPICDELISSAKPGDAEAPIRPPFKSPSFGDGNWFLIRRLTDLLLLAN
jgi:hypothetical protein